MSASILRMLPYQGAMAFVIYTAALADRKWALSYVLLMFLFPLVSLAASFFYAYKNGFSLLFLLVGSLIMLPLMGVYGLWAGVYAAAYAALILLGLGLGHFMRKRYFTLRLYAR